MKPQAGVGANQCTGKFCYAELLRKISQNRFKLKENAQKPPCYYDKGGFLLRG